MKRTFYGTVLIISTCSFPLDSAASAQSGDARVLEQEVRAVEEHRRQAILRNDTKALEQLLAPEQTSITSPPALESNAGKVTTRAQELSVNESTTRQVRSWEPRNVDVCVCGNVGLVTGLAELQDILRGDTRHLIIQYTHIWVKRNGAWPLDHRHVNRVSTITGPQ